MAFVLLLLGLYFIVIHKGNLGSINREDSDFDGAIYWNEDWLNMCNRCIKDTKEKALFCHTFVRNYYIVNVEVLSEDPLLVIFRNFAPSHYVDDFLEDVRKAKLEQVTTYEGENNPYERNNYRRANGSWIHHTASYGVARMFKRAVTLLPFINFVNSEPWQVLSYLPGGHYTPHHDYLEYISTDAYDFWMKNYGNRMASFLLILKTARRGGGTVFPNINKVADPSSGDVVLWTNVNYAGELEVNSLHGGCPVYEGEKIAAILWIRMKGQNVFQSANNRLKIQDLMKR